MPSLNPNVISDSQGFFFILNAISVPVHIIYFISYMFKVVKFK